jgi:hypothetical protein
MQCIATPSSWLERESGESDWQLSVAPKLLEDAHWQGLVESNTLAVGQPSSERGGCVQVGRRVKAVSEVSREM